MITSHVEIKLLLTLLLLRVNNCFLMDLMFCPSTHCAKVQKYKQGKIGLQFHANNEEEYYGKIIKILHRCPFES